MSETIQTGTAGSVSPARKVAIAMYGVLLVAYLLMAADRFLFPVLMTNVREEFGFSLTNAGLLTTIFTLGLGAGGLPTGFLLSHFSRKTVMIVGIAIFSSATALTAVAQGFWSLLFLLAATGIGMAMLATCMFALAASYFSGNRAAAIGSVNASFGLGGICGPILAGVLLASYGSWRVPMVAFGAFGFVMIGVIILTVRPWFSETQHVVQAKISTDKGAASLLNWNTAVLTVLSAICGMSLFGFVGMYPTFLRESLQFSPPTAGFVMSFFGLGALASIAGGWVGDRYSPRIVMVGAFLCQAALGYALFNGSTAVAAQAFLTCALGVVGSAVIYVNLAGYHVKALRSSLSSRGSGMFVTSFYASSAVAGYLMGWLANDVGWVSAGIIQISLFSLVGAALSLALRPREMSL